MNSCTVPAVFLKFFSVNEAEQCILPFPVLLSLLLGLPRDKLCKVSKQGEKWRDCGEEANGYEAHNVCTTRMRGVYFLRSQKTPNNEKCFFVCFFCIV